MEVFFFFSQNKMKIDAWFFFFNETNIRSHDSILVPRRQGVCFTILHKKKNTTFITTIFTI